MTDTNGKTGYVVDTYKNFYRNGSFVERVFISKSVYKTLDTVQRRGTGPAEVRTVVPEQTKPVGNPAVATPTPRPVESPSGAAPRPSPEVTPAAEDRSQSAEEA